MKHCSLKAFTLALLALGAQEASAVSVTISLENLSGANGVAFSPFFLGFHAGGYDPFNAGASASSAIQAIAEMGNGAGLAANFSATQPNGQSLTLSASSNAFGPGIFLPGAAGSVTLDLDPVKNRYLSYFAMVVPSNDRYFGNDSPTEIELFNSAGQFTGGVFVETGSDVWDAGTEVDGLFGAAFLVGSSGADHLAQNGLIGTNFNFQTYAGGATPAGYNFTNLPSTDTPLLRISAVSSVPIPAPIWLMGSALSMFPAFRRQNRPAKNVA